MPLLAVEGKVYSKGNSSEFLRKCSIFQANNLLNKFSFLNTKYLSYNRNPCGKINLYPDLSLLLFSLQLDLLTASGSLYEYTQF